MLSVVQMLLHLRVSDVASMINKTERADFTLTHDQSSLYPAVSFPLLGRDSL